jgi:hypothetical protein
MISFLLALFGVFLVAIAASSPRVAQPPSIPSWPSATNKKQLIALRSTRKSKRQHTKTCVRQRMCLLGPALFVELPTVCEHHSALALAVMVRVNQATVLPSLDFHGQ